jgi:DNA-binding transcriptional LysR family regulator
MQIDLRLMRYVIAVAEEGGFHSAAKKLHMSQPPLSRQIRDLERGLGVRLFERRPTRLTPAGQEFVTTARRVLADAEQLVLNLSQNADRPLTGTVRLGYLPATAWDTLPKLREAVGARHPGITIDAVEQWNPDRRLVEDDDPPDLALTRCGLDDPRLERRTVRREHLLALLPATSPLIDRPAVSLRDLSDHTFCYFPRRRAPAYHDAVLAALTSTGETFEVWEYPIPNAPLNFTVVPSSTAPHLPDGLVVRPISDPLPTFDLELLWNPESLSPTAGAVISTAMNLADEESWLYSVV